MDFGGALKALKEGERVERAGWNGKGMWVALMTGYPEGVEANDATVKAHRLKPGSTVVVRPYLVMRAVDGSLVNWTVSQTDALAEDWSTVTPEG